MKIFKKVFAVLAVTALCASTALPLAACGDKELGRNVKMNLSDYAKDLSEYTQSAEYSKPKVASVTRALSYGNAQTISSGNDDIILVTDLHSQGYSSQYNAFSLQYGKYVAVGIAGSPEYFTVSGLPVQLMQVRYEKAYDYETSIIAFDGTVLLAGAVYSDYDVECLDAYVGKSDKTCKVLHIVAEKATSKVTTVENYFKVEKDDDGKYVFTPIDEKTVSLTNPSYTVGTQFDENFTKIYQNDEYPVTGDVADVGYIRYGNTYKFYKDGAEKGGVTLKNSLLNKFVGDFFYYDEVTPVESGAKTGYNLVISSGMYELKFKYNLYRYNVLNNVNEKLSFGVYVDDLQPVYNYKTKCFDAALMSGIKMTNGVAYMISAGSASMGDAFSYFTDDKLNVGFDVTSIYESTSNYIYKISDNRYLAGEYVVNENFKIVGSYYNTATPIYGNEGFVSFTVGEYLGFKDFTGKIIIEPKYRPYDESEGITFVGGYAYCYERQEDGTDLLVFLKSDGTSELVTERTGVNGISSLQSLKIYPSRGIYIKGEPLSSSSMSSWKYRIYNFDGEELEFFYAERGKYEFVGNYFKTSGTTIAYYTLNESPAEDKEDKVEDKAEEKE